MTSYMFCLRCSLGVETKGYIFSPIPIKMAYYDPERAAVNLLRQSISTDTNETPIKTGLERFENVLGNLEGSIDGLLAYVEKVKVRRKPRDILLILYDDVEWRNTS